MRYKNIVKLYKNYELPTGTKHYLVGYFRDDGSASAEESYLKRAEKEPVPISFTTEVEPATLYPDVVARWEAEDAEERRRREEASRPIMLPLISKRWPTLLKEPGYPGLSLDRPDVVSYARTRRRRRK